MELLVTTEHSPTPTKLDPQSISSSNVSSSSSITIWNPSTGTKLISLKSPQASPGSLVLLRDEGIIIAEGGGKPFLHLWQVGYPLTSSRRIICPLGGGGVHRGQGGLGPMTCSPDGNFIVLAIGEKINVWMPATGRLVQVISSAHYRPVTVLKFTQDDGGTLLISGGADGIVSVWNFLQLVSSSEVVKPMYSWAGHTLPVTSIHVGIGGGGGGGNKAHLFTCSEDRFVKIYSLLSGSLLLSIAFPGPLTSIVVDRLERGLLVGGGDGTIYIFNIALPPRALEAQVTHQNDTGRNGDGVLKKHSARVTAMSISADGKNLASGDAEGLIIIWDLDSRQAIRTIGIGSKGGGPVTNLSYWLNDPELLKGGRGKKPSIVFPEVPKLIESNDDDGGEELVRVWNRIDQEEEDENISASGGNNSGGGGSMAEINHLKAQLSQSREINRKLQHFFTTTLFDSSSSHNNSISTNNLED